MTRSNFPKRVEEELSRARVKHGPIKTLHEAYGVIMEEVCEFFDHVRADSWKDDTGRRLIIAELMQIAAMCQRTAEDVLPDAIEWLEE